MRRLLLLTLPALLVLLLIAAPAHAGLWDGAEPAGDAATLESIDPDQLCGPVTATPAPEQTSVDIVRLKVRHSPRVVRVDVTFRDLLRTGAHRTVIRVRTPDESYVVSVRRERTGGATRVGLAALFDPGRPRSARRACFYAASISCSSLRGRIWVGKDRVRVAVPRSCLDDPAWVRVAADATTDGDDTPVVTDAWAPHGGPTTGAVGAYSPVVRPSS